MRLPVGQGGLYETALYAHSEQLTWGAGKAAKAEATDLGLTVIEIFGAVMCHPHQDLTARFGFTVWAPPAAA